MGRPTRLTKADVRFIIEHYGAMDTKAMGERLGVDRSTVSYWVKRLRIAGFRLNKRTNYSEANNIIADLQKEYGVIP